MTLDGHWEWSEGGDDADTADLGGDAGHDLHGGYGEDYGTGFGDDGIGHEDLGGPGQHLSDGHIDGGSHDDLEEPLGTEHATAEYDEAVHGHDDTGEPGDHEDPADHQEPADHVLHLSDGHVDGATDDGHHEAFGTDPDVDASADDPAWHEVQFPEELHLQDPPEPVDGFPWSDADVLGGPDHSLSAAFDPAVHSPAEPAGLAEYEHLEMPSGADPWSLLLGSDDPATSSLATFWAPQ
ncbi:hypothetical protein [Dactylosporangium sp. CA-233914]|uniref:hypothetical protein n=1 Tax=Dactylosporangium sp. CA-233914 TaxID=3239934 RepID=UPI003D91DF52